MESSQFSENVFQFIKENLLIVGLALAGLVFLGVGIWQLSNHKDGQITFEKGGSGSGLPLASGSKTSGQVKGAQASVQLISVDVSGHVEKPGVYKLPVDSRVQDALTAAGGLSETANQDYVSRSINRAQKLSDGSKIYIPAQGELSGNTMTTSAGNGLNATGQININSASEKELDSLPGVGAVTAQKIIDGRPYSDMNELLTKKAVTKSVFEKIRDKITLY